MFWSKFNFLIISRPFLVANKEIKKNNTKTPKKIKLLKRYEVAVKAKVFNNINDLKLNSLIFPIIFWRIFFSFIIFFFSHKCWKFFFFYCTNLLWISIFFCNKSTCIFEPWLENTGRLVAEKDGDSQEISTIEEEELSALMGEKEDYKTEEDPSEDDWED